MGKARAAEPPRNDSPVPPVDPVKEDHSLMKNPETKDTTLSQLDRRTFIKTAGVAAAAMGGIEGILAATIDVEGEEKPACAAELVFRFY